jgi:hypothetical protein
MKSVRILITTVVLLAAVSVCARQPALKPARLSTSLHPYANTPRLLLNSAIELLGFLAMRQSAFLPLASSLSPYAIC